ncbi:serine hydrolase [Burkholderia sp. Ax-1724]|nr:serine hydrolase [Burkholderia sp. Ax-1724]
MPESTAVSNGLPSASPSNVFSDGLERAVPSMTGVNADAVVSFLDDVEAAGLDLHGFMLSRDGRVVAEGFRWPYRADRTRIMHSATKSFVASAIAFALAEGRLKLTDKVVSFFPELYAGPVEGWLAQMTVEDLLTMRAGHESETSGAVWRVLNTSWIAEFFKIPLAHEPGSTFVYTSAASYMLSAILSRVTGQLAHDYLKPRLLEPLGVTGETWDVSPDGINPGGNGFSARLVDLLKLGMLHAQDGVWNGQRVLPEDWVRVATQPHGEPFKYGYHWWTRPDGSYSAIGRFVQMVTVFPEHNAALAVMGAIQGSFRLFPHIEQHFPAAFTNGDTAASASASADKRLIEKLAHWQHEEAPTLWKEPLRKSATAAWTGARRFEIEANRYGVEAVQFACSDDRCSFTQFDARGAHTIVAGIGHWIEGRTDMPGSDLHHGYEMNNSAVVARATWIDDKRLQMVWIFPETAFRDTVEVLFDGTGITAQRSVNVNGSSLRHDELVGREAR